MVDLVGATAIFDLPFGLLITERLLFRHLVANSTGRGTDDDVLWITHAAMNVIYDLDVAAEYRLWGTFDGELGHGALLELGYTLLDHARIAIGYDFSSVPRDMTLDAASGAGGVYARITGSY
jgi:hypothetical protein